MYHFLGSINYFVDEANEILKTLWVVWLNIKGFLLTPRNEPKMDD